MSNLQIVVENILIELNSYSECEIKIIINNLISRLKMDRKIDPYKYDYLCEE